MMRRSWVAFLTLVCTLALLSSVQAQSPVQKLLQNAATANGNGTVASTLGFSLAAVQTVAAGGFNGTINFEGTVDGTTYVSILCTNIASGATATTATASSVFLCPVSGTKFFRARISGISAGNATVNATFLQNVSRPSSGSGGGGGGTGTVTDITCGTGLTCTPNPISTSGTIDATGGAAAGSNTQVMFNDTGALAGDAGLTFNKTTDILTLGEAGATNTIVIKGTTSGQSTILPPASGTLNFQLPTAGGTFAVSATSPVALSAAGAISVGDAAADGSTKGILTLAAADFNCTAGACSIDYTNGQAASGSLNGFLSSTDWTTFNNKLSTSRTLTVSGTSNEIAVSGGTQDLTANRTWTISLPTDMSLAAHSLLLPSSTTLPATCSVGQVYFDTDATAGQNIYGCTATNTWTLEGDGGGSPGGADTQVQFNDGGSFGGDAGLTYNKTTNTLTTDTFVGALTGNASTATALASNPTDCSSNQFATAIAANGNLTCAQPAFTDLSGTVSDAQVPNLNTLSTGLIASRCVETDGSGLLSVAAGACGTGGGITSLGGQTGSTQTITRGAGIGGTDSSNDHSFTTASGEADFLASGALTCGAGTQGKMQVHTTALQYCDNAATPALQYAAYGTSTGLATAGDSATAFFTTGQIEAARGGTGSDSSGSTGVARVASGTWSFNAGISHLASSTSADLAGVLSNETGTGTVVFNTGPTLDNPFIQSTDGTAGLLSITGAAAASLIRGFVSEGTTASKTYPVADRQLLAAQGYGWDENASTFQFRSGMELMARQNWTSTAQGTYWRLRLTPNGSTTTTENMRVHTDGTKTSVTAKGPNGSTNATMELCSTRSDNSNGFCAQVPLTADDTVTENAATQTLTNKRVTKRTGSTTSSATPTINTDNVDMYLLTAQAVDITSFTTNLSGTPTEGQTLWIVIVGTAARAITWGSSFEASTVALPTTTVSTNRLDVGFVWNSATSKWRVVAVA